jgi:hypothetical protein
MPLVKHWQQQYWFPVVVVVVVVPARVESK